MSASRLPRASCSGSSGRTAPGRRRSSTCCPGSTARPPARSSSAGATSRSSRRRAAHARGTRPDVPGVERLPAAQRARERPARGGGGARRHAAPLAARRERERRRSSGRARRSRASGSSRTRRGPAGALAHGDKRRLEIAMLLAADKPRPAARRADGRALRRARAAARRADPCGSHARSARRC